MHGFRSVLRSGEIDDGAQIQSELPSVLSPKSGRTACRLLVIETGKKWKQLLKHPAVTQVKRVPLLDSVLNDLCPKISDAKLYVRRCRVIAQKWHEWICMDTSAAERQQIFCNGSRGFTAVTRHLAETSDSSPERTCHVPVLDGNAIAPCYVGLFVRVCPTPQSISLLRLGVYGILNGLTESVPRRYLLLQTADNSID